MTLIAPKMLLAFAESFRVAAVRFDPWRLR
jgi:hypothetical protein